MTSVDLTDDLRQHHLSVLRARRRAMILWLVLAMACVSLGSAALISWPLLVQNGLAWALGLFALSGAGFIYVVSAVDRSSKSLWPRDIRHVAEALKAPTPSCKG